jgi:hypothetical protein
VVKALAVALAVLLAFVPRRRTLAQAAALAAAVIIAVQLTAEHWFYLYIPWFFGLLMAGLSGPSGEPDGFRTSDATAMGVGGSRLTA